MRLLPLGLLSALFITSSLALHESDVGVVDWHKRLIGVPLIDSISTAPTFHRVGGKNTQSVVLTATENNVLAALNPVNGSVAWRYLFEPHDRIVKFQKHENVVAALSGPGGATLRTLDVLTGELIHETRLHSPSLGALLEPNHLGTFIAYGVDASDHYDLFVLTNGHTVNHLSGTTGTIKWTWTSPDQSSLVVYSNLVVTPSAIYVVGLAKSFASYTLHVTSLSPSDGEVLSSANIPSSILDGLTGFLTLTTESPHLIWLELGSIKTFPLVPTLKGKATTLKDAAYKQILDVGLNPYGRIVAIKADGSGSVIKLEGNELKSIWYFEGSAATDRHTESIYSGGLDKLKNPYVTRVYWSLVLKQASAEIFSSHLGDGKGLVTGFSFPFETNNHGIIEHVAIDAASPKDWTVVGRLVLTTSTGAVQLWTQDQLQWTREESLSSIAVSKFVELPERVVTHAGEEHESFIGRVTRQINDAQDFPQYLVNFIKRFATGSYASASSSAAVSSHDGSLSRDAFGFRQIIVVATAYGKVFGIDSSNGEILWNRILALGWAGEAGGSPKLFPVKLFVTKTVSDGETPAVVLLTQRRADNSLVDTVLFHFDALTGESAMNDYSAKGDLLHGLDIINGPVAESFLLNDESKILVLLDEFLQVYLYPDTEDSKAIFAKAAPKLHLPLLMNSPGQRRVVGHQLISNPSLSDRYTAYPAWTLSLLAEESIQTFFPASRGPIASLGKVLGNRTTLYKYLNPHLSVVLTASHSIEPGSCGIYVVDGTKGSVVYRASVPAAKGSCDVKATLTENWLVYHYYDAEIGTGQAKGYRMITVELYEGKKIDEKTKSSDMSSFSPDSVDVTAYEQAYVFPGGITAIATTSTKFGITSKDIIVANRNHRIQSFPRRFLNPRRPSRKTTAEEQEEYLVSYDPLLPNDSKRVLSHNYEVANIQHIITAPALLESTSLVFAHGLDLFLTRVAPSNTFDVLSENFNKLQLVLTVSGLALAILFTKPMVQRKRLRERWYQ